MYYTITTFPCHMAIVKPTTAVMISFVVYESTFLHISATHMTKVFVKGTMVLFAVLQETYFETSLITFELMCFMLPPMHKSCNFHDTIGAKKHIYKVVIVLFLPAESMHCGFVMRSWSLQTHLTIIVTQTVHVYMHTLHTLLAVFVHHCGYQRNYLMSYALGYQGRNMQNI